MFAKLSIKLFIIFVFIFPYCGIIQAQDTIVKKDSITEKDSITFTVTPKHKTSSDALEAKVEYTCTDSMIFNIKDQKVFLYRDAEIKYQNITLTAAYVEINFEKNTIYAKGLLDSAGKEYGTPVFIEGEKKFRSKEMTYNYKSKKGIIKEVITQEGEGFLHGTTIKKLPNDEILIKSGLYTTCDLDHPHYQIQFKKGKVYPNDKIVIGPADLIIGDVPTPLMIPFGYFPNKKGRASGIVFPAYGESTELGFYLQKGGYYFGISDMVDTKITGDIYSKGSWGMESTTQYNKRYKYRGNIQLNYVVIKTGEFGAGDFKKNKAFRIFWTHAQDPKSRPNSSFSANVNASTNKYDQRSLTSSTTAYLSNEMNSRISYSTTLFQKYHLTADLSHNQNTSNHQINFELPHISFSADKFYPLRKKILKGKLKWYENIGVGYSNDIRNSLSTYDTVKYNSDMLKQMRNGMNHSIPISYSTKVLKYFNLSNTFSYTESWYLHTYDQNWINNPSTNTGKIEIDTINGFKAARYFSFNTSLSTKLYGMYQFKKFYVKALRHVITPTFGCSYNPDFSKQNWGYYKYYVNSIENSGKVTPQKYSIFSGLYGQPPANESGSLNFRLSNNLEMKVRSKKDTINGIKKIILIEDFSFSTSYDIAKDSLKWAPLFISGRTKLFKVLDVTYRSEWDPYYMDTLGNRYNRFEYNESKHLFRHTSTRWEFNLNYNLSPQTFKKKNTENTTKTETNFYNVPWSMNIGYSLSSTDIYAKPTFKKKNTILQTLSLNGDLSLTPKWKISVFSGYDFVGKKLSYTTVTLYRDLHCWEMLLNWTPYGARQSYNFTIRVKASMLQDLKLEKKSDNNLTY